MAVISKSHMNREDAWIRRRICQILVVSWKRNHTCFKALMALTDSKMEEKCRMATYTGLGKWAKGREFNYIFTNKRLLEPGWESVGQFICCRKGGGIDRNGKARCYKG